MHFKQLLETFFYPVTLYSVVKDVTLSTLKQGRCWEAMFLRQ